MIKNGEFLKKVAYAISANFLSLVTSLLTTLIVPKFLGADISQYGYLQIYSFYVGYLGFFHFGWCDGIFLRDGGKKYEDLEPHLYSSQFWVLFVFELIISLVIVLIGLYFVNDINYKFVWLMIAVNVIVLLPSTMLAYYLQTTNRIKEYASITTVGRSIYGVLIIVTVLFCDRKFWWFVLGDVVGKIAAIVVSIWWCRDIVFCKPSSFSVGLREGIINISVGIKLLFANLASLLITGIVRWGIQQQWDVATYGKISLTLSVSNLLLTFISAVALVLYPTLKRRDESNLACIYDNLHNALMIPLLGCLILYYPVKIVLSAWLPQYSESLNYLAILFPMCIYAAKMTMLVQTYMNVYRLEKQIMLVNIIGVVVAVFTTAISVFLLKSLTLSMLSIVINQMFRCIFAEIVLSKHINIKSIKNIILEVALTIIFITVNWYVGGWIGVGIYTITYIIYLLIKRKEIKTLVDLFHLINS